jgi:integrase
MSTVARTKKTSGPKPPPKVLEKGITRRANGVFTTRWRDEYGRNRSKDSSDYWELVAFRAERKAAKLRGTWQEANPGRQTLGAYCEAYAAAKVRTKRWKPGTVELHRLTMLSLEGAGLLGKQLADLTEADVVAWLDYLRRPRSAGGRGMAESTVAVRLAHLRAILGVASKGRRPAVTFDVSRSAEVAGEAPRARTGKRKLRAEDLPTRAEVAALREAMPPAYRLLVVLGDALGLRPSEARGLRVCDVDFLRREVHVRGQLVRTAGRGEVYGPPKTPESVRTVPVTAEVIEAIAAHLAEHRPGASGTAHLLVTGRGKHLDRGTARFAWDRANLAVFDGPRWRLHDLRHHFASELLAQGVDVVTVAALLGHSNAQTVIETYARPTEDSAEAARAAMLRRARAAVAVVQVDSGAL